MEFNDTRSDLESNSNESSSAADVDSTLSEMSKIEDADNAVFDNWIEFKEAFDDDEDNWIEFSGHWDTDDNWVDYNQTFDDEEEDPWTYVPVMCDACLVSYEIESNLNAVIEKLPEVPENFEWNKTVYLYTEKGQKVTIVELCKSLEKYVVPSRDVDLFGDLPFYGEVPIENLYILVAKREEVASKLISLSTFDCGEIKIYVVRPKRRISC